ncbi:hypothetical protein EZV62_004207 [Acer yangbiense]|uniref:Disease resistance protein At4g27190-like leucine-rich repeats domain-containing protein n=1 Tax=Acer yangbiense TaxID=1000413 RepID=A0A5C7IKX7_9ROSI|nr:hypothetical protein EZV62_004207 [Acer yangbiense]
MGNICSVSISCDAIFSRCVQCFITKASYISQLEDNLVRLQSELQKLIHTRNDVMRRVIIDERSLQMKRTDQVEGWLLRVQAAENQVAELQKLKDEETQKLCLGGYCSNNCKSSYNFGKRVHKMLKVVTCLQNQGDFKNVAEKIPEAPVDEIPIDPTIVGLPSTFDKVLNLSSNGLVEFPLGISRLVSLQHLDLSYSKIKELPEELKALANLRCLNLSYMHYLHRVPQRLISSIAKLRIFRLFKYSWKLRPVGDNVLSGGGEYFVEELLCLKYLKALSIELKGSCALGKFLKSQKLQSCTQFLRLEGLEESLDVVSLTGMKHLYQLNINSYGLEELKIDYCQGEIQKIRESHCFHSLGKVIINGCIKLRDATWLVFAPNLKNIIISYCGDMEEVISVEKSGQVKEENPFAKLEYLILLDLRRLKSIYWKPLPFPHLKYITARACPSLEKLPLDFNNVKYIPIFRNALQMLNSRIATKLFVLKDSR